MASTAHKSCSGSLVKGRTSGQLCTVSEYYVKSIKTLILFLTTFFCHQYLNINWLYINISVVISTATVNGRVFCFVFEPNNNNWFSHSATMKKKKCFNDIFVVFGPSIFEQIMAIPLFYPKRIIYDNKHCSRTCSVPRWVSRYRTCVFVLYSNQSIAQKQ